MVDKLVHHHDYTHHLHCEQGDDIFMTSPLNHLEVSLVGKSEYVIVEGTEKLAAVTSGSEAFFCNFITNSSNNNTYLYSCICQANNN